MENQECDTDKALYLELEALRPDLDRGNRSGFAKHTPNVGTGMERSCAVAKTERQKLTTIYATSSLRATSI